MRNSLSWCLVLVFVAAGGAQALETHMGPSTHSWGDGLGAYDCPGVEKWLQGPDPDGSLTAAQDDVTIGFRAQTADDFMGDGETLKSIGWWGGYWNGSPAPPDAFEIQLFLKAFGDCPGEMVYQEVDAEYHESLVGSDADYCIELDEPLLKAEGENYSMSITALLVFPPQWGWATSLEGNGKQCCFRSEYFSFPDWVPGDQVFGVIYEMAFVLFNEGASPVEKSSWTSIKDQYRGTDGGQGDD